MGKKSKEPGQGTSQCHGVALNKSEVESSRRTLKKEPGEVSVGPDGFPKMLLTQSDSDGSPSDAESAAGASESCLGKSTPPVLKKL